MFEDNRLKEAVFLYAQTHLKVQKEFINVLVLVV